MAYGSISSGKSIHYDSRTTSASVNGAGSTTSVVDISNPPVSMSPTWVGKEFIDLGGTCKNFGESISGVQYQYVVLNLTSPLPAAPDDGSEFEIINLGGPTVVFDSSASDAEVYGPSSTSSVVYIENPPSGTGVSWSGYIISFTTGNLTGYFQYIDTSVNAGNLGLTLTAPMPTVPSNSEFVIVATDPVVLGDKSFDLPDPVGLTFNTYIEGGYETARAQFFVPGRLSTLVASNLSGKALYIFDDYGDIVWEGIVVSAFSQGDEVSVSALGFADSFNYYVYSRYWDTDDGAGGVTTPIDVIEDLIANNPILRNDLFDVDGDGSIRSNHTALGSYQFDFSETAVSAREALDDALRFGDGSNQFNPIYLQVWNDRRAKLFASYSQSSLEDATPDWIVDGTTRISDNDFVSVEFDSSDTRNMVSVVYSDLETGAQNRTAFYYDLDSLLDMGARASVRSEGSLDSGNAIGAAGIIAGSLNRATRVSPIKILGKMRRYGSMGLEDAYRVRAGDIVSLPIEPDSWGGTGDSLSYQVKYVIARTQYDAIRKELTIEPHVVQNRVDVFLAGVI